MCVHRRLLPIGGLVEIFSDVYQHLPPWLKYDLCSPVATTLTTSRLNDVVMVKGGGEGRGCAGFRTERSETVTIQSLYLPDQISFEKKKSAMCIDVLHPFDCFFSNLHFSDMSTARPGRIGVSSNDW